MQSPWLFWSVALVHPFAVPVLARGRVGPRAGPRDTGGLGDPARRRRASPSPIGERWKTGTRSGNACEKGMIVMSLKVIVKRPLRRSEVRIPF